jgi:hypothetical protein
MKCCGNIKLLFVPKALQFTGCEVNALATSDSTSGSHVFAVQKNKEAEEYANLLNTRKAEIRERRSESLAKKRAARMASQASVQA